MGADAVLPGPEKHPLSSFAQASCFEESRPSEEGTWRSSLSAGFVCLFSGGIHGGVVSVLGLLNPLDGSQSWNLKNRKIGFTRTHFPAVINPF